MKIRRVIFCFLALSALLHLGTLNDLWGMESNGDQVIPNLETTITINQDGDFLAPLEMKAFYPKGSKILVIVKQVGRPFFFETELVEEKKLEFETKSFEVDSHSEKFHTERVTTSRITGYGFEKLFSLGKAGVQYRIKITRYKNRSDLLVRSNGVLILNQVFITFAKYHVRPQVGLYLPFRSIEKYGLIVSKNAQSSAIEKRISRTRSYQANVISFISVYPFGFDPENWIKQRYYHTFHINAGTEISSSFLKALYFGFGFSARYVSVDLFASLGKEYRLSPGFEDGELVDSNLSEVPLEERDYVKFGIAIAFPLDIAVGMLGNLLGF